MSYRRVSTGILLALLAEISLAASDIGPSKVLETLLARICSAQNETDLSRIAINLPGFSAADASITRRRMMTGKQVAYDAEGGRITIDWLAPKGMLHHIQVQLQDQARRPRAYAMIDNRCTLKAVRVLRYDARGIAAWLDVLDSDFRVTQSTALNPPVPAASGDLPPPGSVPVAPA